MEDHKEGLELVARKKARLSSGRVISIEILKDTDGNGLIKREDGTMEACPPEILDVIETEQFWGEEDTIPTMVYDIALSSAGMEPATPESTDENADEGCDEIILSDDDTGDEPVLDLDPDFPEEEAVIELEPEPEGMPAAARAGSGIETQREPLRRKKEKTENGNRRIREKKEKTEKNRKQQKDKPSDDGITVVTLKPDGSTTEVVVKKDGTHGKGRKWLVAIICLFGILAAAFLFLRTDTGVSLVAGIKDMLVQTSEQPETGTDHQEESGITPRETITQGNTETSVAESTGAAPETEEADTEGSLETEAPADVESTAPETETTAYEAMTETAAERQQAETEAPATRQEPAETQTWQQTAEPETEYAAEPEYREETDAKYVPPETEAPETAKPEETLPDDQGIVIIE